MDELNLLIMERDIQENYINNYSMGRDLPKVLPLMEERLFKIEEKLIDLKLKLKIPIGG